VTRAEIIDELRKTMSEMFEIEPASITLESRLFEDLDLDSIDAIDMAVKLQELTGRRVDETALRKIRTVEDVVDLIERLFAGQDA